MARRKRKPGIAKGKPRWASAEFDAAVESDLNVSELDQLLRRGLRSLLESSPGRNATTTPNDLAKLVEEARAFAAGLPTPAQWEIFFNTEVRPRFNSPRARVWMCEECGARFPRKRAVTRFCSRECKSRAAVRGRDKLGGGKSPFERRFQRERERIGRHKASCALCQQRRPCERVSDLIDRTDALTRAGIGYDDAIAVGDGDEE